MSGAVCDGTNDLTYEELREALEFYFSRIMGVSSEAMFREALGIPLRSAWSNRPWDRHDSAGTEETYAAAPEWLQKRMLPRLLWYRQIALLNYPPEPPARAALTSPEARP